jgi:hypothetical protein
MVKVLKVPYVIVRIFLLLNEDVFLTRAHVHTHTHLFGLYLHGKGVTIHLGSGSAHRLGGRNEFSVHISNNL